MRFLVFCGIPRIKKPVERFKRTDCGYQRDNGSGNDEQQVIARQDDKQSQIIEKTLAQNQNSQDPSVAAYCDIQVFVMFRSYRRYESPVWQVTTGGIVNRSAQVSQFVPFLLNLSAQAFAVRKEPIDQRLGFLQFVQAFR